MRPAQLLPRLPGVEGHVGELHAALQQPLHVLREAGLLHADGRETCWGGGGGGRLVAEVTDWVFIAHFRPRQRRHASLKKNWGGFRWKYCTVVTLRKRVDGGEEQLWQIGEVLIGWLL